MFVSLRHMLSRNNRFDPNFTFSRADFSSEHRIQISIAALFACGGKKSRIHNNDQPIISHSI